LDRSDIIRYLEACLFVADGPVAIEDLATALQVDSEAIEEALAELGDASEARGLHLNRVGKRVQMVTAADVAPVIERFLGINTASKLSAAAMETLAIIAYRQPITRAQIEALRGVNSDSVIRTLQARDLVEAVGHLQQAGRPELLGTTFEFLQYFGVDSLEALPTLPEFEEEPPVVPAHEQLQEGGEGD
jgi:segregation and condensation protein B